MRAIAAAPLVRRGPGRPPGPSQAADVRARIVAEASRQYANRGYAGLSLGSVAAAVGITKPTVFHYFPTKDALAVAVFDALGERLRAQAHAWFDAPPATHAARLERALRGLVRFYGADPVNAKLVCQGLLEVDRFVGARTENVGVFADFVRRFVRFVESGIAAGEFHADRPLGTIVAIGGAVLFECMVPAEARRRYGGGTPSLDERAGELITFVRRAVARPARRKR